jgi:uncharacterized protein
MSIEIKAGTVLPARREPLAFTTADGLRLVGELALPADREPRGTLLCLHPNPAAGGFMDSHVQRKASWRLPALADLAVLRFNTRGTSSPAGTSEGSFDEGESERYDVEAAVAEAARHGLTAPPAGDHSAGDNSAGDNLWLLGWSFGTDLALRWGCLPEVRGAILLSPPLRFSGDADLDVWAASGKPVVAVVPELDDYLRPDEARARFARIPQTQVVGVDGAKHLWVGESNVRRVLNEVVAVAAPWALPLPTTWDGPYQTWNDLTGGLT